MFYEERSLTTATSSSANAVREVGATGIELVGPTAASSSHRKMMTDDSLILRPRRRHNEATRQGEEVRVMQSVLAGSRS